MGLSGSIAYDWVYYMAIQLGTVSVGSVIMRYSRRYVNTENWTRVTYVYFGNLAEAAASAASIQFTALPWPGPAIVRVEINV